MSGQASEYYGANYGATPNAPPHPPQEPPPPYTVTGAFNQQGGQNMYYGNSEEPKYDSEQQRSPQQNNSNNFANFTEEALRRAFIRKVYIILMVQLLITVGIVTIFTFVEPVKDWVRENMWFYILSYVVFFVSYIALVCCPNVRRRYPGNYISLFIFTLAMSYMTGTIAAYHQAWAVCIALGICALVCLGVTFFAICTKIDFTKLTAYLIFFGLAFVLFGFACMIVYLVSGPNKVLQAVYGGIGAILFSLYLCYDTQMIIGGRRYELSEEEYITGAIQIYMDVVQIFLMLLAIVGIGEK